MNGRLSARYQQNGADQAVHGSFNWSQSADRTQVTLLSPLGQTLAAITVQPEKASLIQAGQPMREATDVDTLAASALGWPLPVSGLREWMQGFVTDANGRRFQATPDMPAGVLTSDGWRLTFANWQPLDNLPGQSRPKRIDLERGTMQAGDVSLRIVIDDWQPR